MIPIAEFAPDRSRFDPQSSDTIINAVPTADGWAPMKNLSLISQALGSLCKGAVFVRGSTGSFDIVAGTATGLYKFVNANGSWTDISGSSAPFGVPDGDHWSFAVFGSKLVAANISDPIQVYDIDAGGAFADLAGSPPKARHAWIANGYLVLGNTNSSAKRIQWSGLENIEYWTVGNRGADYQDLPDGGDIAGGIGDEAGAFVFQRDRVRRMDFAPGSAFTFNFKDVDTARGAVSPRSIVSVGQGDFVYLSESGFFRGAESNPIGAETVDRWFFDQVDLDFLVETQGAADPFNKLVWWLFRAPDASRQMIGYDWQLDRWTRSNADPTILVGLATSGYGLDDLDAINTSLDALPYSLDSRVWSGGRPAFAAFDNSHKLGFFEGQNRAATLETAEIALSQGSRTFVNGFRPLCDAGDLTGQVGRKDKEGDAANWSSAITPSSVTGLIPCRASAKLHRFRLNIAADDIWSICHGVEEEAIREGRR